MELVNMIDRDQANWRGAVISSCWLNSWT